MQNSKSFWLSAPGIGALTLIAIASYFLLMEHRQHVFAALPYLLILACPLSHFFMHGKHHKHGERNE